MPGSSVIDKENNNENVPFTLGKVKNPALALSSLVLKLHSVNTSPSFYLSTEVCKTCDSVPTCEKKTAAPAGSMSYEAWPQKEKFRCCGSAS